jgi:hypothetical protein
MVEAGKHLIMTLIYTISQFALDFLYGLPVVVQHWDFVRPCPPAIRLWSLPSSAAFTVKSACCQGKLHCVSAWQACMKAPVEVAVRRDVHLGFQGHHKSILLLCAVQWTAPL